MEYIDDADDAELIDECYNYGEDYVEPTAKPEEKKPQNIRRSRRKFNITDVVVDVKLNCGKYLFIRHFKRYVTDIVMDWQVEVARENLQPLSERFLGRNHAVRRL